MAAVKRLSSGNMIVRSTIFYIHIIYIYMCTGMSMVLSKWIITPIKVGCKSRK